jgi:hypothetical protein
LLDWGAGLDTHRKDRQDHFHLSGGLNDLKQSYGQ